MTPRWTASLLWGLVGTLAFLVFHQGYLLAGGNFVGYGPVAVVLIAVFGVATITSYYVEGYVVDEGSTADAAADESVSDAPDDGTDGWVWAGDQSEADRQPKDGSE